jgi:aryl-alcohol dehydrogenase-like predicted oxidoreductase
MGLAFPELQDGFHALARSSSPANIRAVVEGLLEATGTDHINLYFQHPGLRVEVSRVSESAIS